MISKADQYTGRYIMWNFMFFKTAEARDNYIRKNKHRIQYEIVYINNGYGIEYRKLKRIRFKPATKVIYN